ncbi:hypothetical protein KJZ63_03945 [Patescibacteria group bacterium]|nr:hypothetical protein [Patescibacteria group bacterium]
MMSPNFGEASNSMEQPPVFNEPEGRFVQDPNSSGLIVPERIARNKAAQVQTEPQVQGADTTGNLPESLPFDPDLVPNVSNEPVAETAAKRSAAVEEAMNELEGTGVTQAQSEEEAVDMMKKAATDAGADPQEAETRAKKLMDRAAAIAGMTFNEFKAANEGSSLKTFLDAFLVFGTEGRFGDTSASSLRESLGKDTDDAYLNEVLEKGGSQTLLTFFREVLEKPNLQDLNEIKDLVKEFNMNAELRWDELHSRMADFLNDAKGQYKERSFVKIKALFARLEGMSAENILKYFKIDPEQETADKAVENPSATSATSGEAQASSAPTPESSQEEAEPLANAA